MAQTINIKEENNDAIFHTKSHDDFFCQQSEEKNASDNEFNKDWNDAMLGEEFWGKIETTIRTHFKNKE